MTTQIYTFELNFQTRKLFIAKLSLVQDSLFSSKLLSIGKEKNIFLKQN